MSIAYVVLKLEKGGQTDPLSVFPFSKKPSLGRFKTKNINQINVTVGLNLIAAQFFLVRARLL